MARSEAADRLKAEVRDYVAAQAQRLLVGAGHKLGETTVKLNDIASGESPGFARLALDGGRKLAEGKGPLRTALEVGAVRAKDNVKEALKGLGKKGKKSKSAAGKKPTVVMEHVDVGVPLRTAYDQWTRFQDFGSFAKGVKSADRADDTRSDWRLKVFWSSRSWQAMTTQQVPDERIAWTSQGAKGTTKGAVTFHRLADNLTRVLLVIEYYPAGLFERTGNLWRAQGRRTRLDLKNYARFITLKGESEEGWRGEIHDGKVVLSHEDAMAEEDVQDTEDGEELEAEYEEEAAPPDEYEDEEADAEELEYDEEEPEADEEPDDTLDTEEDAPEQPTDTPARIHRAPRSRR
ncbi:SRPBCC family protein [Streptomyces acidiscabies]|uniref:SRPBCC family protein n=1 Tax=Streptomyces acidiscabies TaxID=42234 RepID=A0AAP6B521_9ACTN|nr:SRPBCC family protein [Streptomyces acidiscabies]MBZ3912837.1 SRPBCC family protein [Streptomyces acidiscabies]MDX2958321.1 SRPBCC family protein [Streptomyces acidiscabies]MDX3018688.1 SRPBCC family protein [Streptomyces acidiscabies]MDX3791009.1 SRPBCC family protein [Streptomyces acidiscabies]